LICAIARHAAFERHYYYCYLLMLPLSAMNTLPLRRYLRFSIVAFDVSS